MRVTLPLGNALMMDIEERGDLFSHRARTHVDGDMGLLGM